MTLIVTSVLIIGSNGGFGDLLARQFRGEGLEVSGMDVHPAPRDPAVLARYISCDARMLSPEARQLAHEANWTVVAIPEQPAIDALPALVAATAPGALVADIASVKTRIVAAARACVPADREYASVHPLFGPQERFDGNVTIVPVRDGPASAELARTLKRWGAQLLEMSADEHDRCMAMIQVISHAAILALGATTTESGILLDRLRATSTPVHAALRSLVARVTAGDPTMYWDIQRNNPHGEAARRALGQSLERLRAALANDDYGSFLGLFSAARRAVESTGEPRC